MDGRLIGHASYTYWFNGLRLPEGEGWLAKEIDPDRILVDAAWLRMLRASDERTTAALSSLGVSLPIMTAEDSRRWVLGPEIGSRTASLCRLGAC